MEDLTFIRITPDQVLSLINLSKLITTFGFRESIAEAIVKNNEDPQNDQNIIDSTFCCIKITELYSETDITLRSLKMAAESKAKLGANRLVPENYVSVSQEQLIVLKALLEDGRYVIDNYGDALKAAESHSEEQARALKLTVAAIGETEESLTFKLTVPVVEAQKLIKEIKSGQGFARPVAKPTLMN